MDLSHPDNAGAGADPAGPADTDPLCVDERPDRDIPIEIHRRADREMVRLLYANTRVMIAGSIAACLLLALVAWPVVPPHLGAAWLAAMGLILGWRWRLVRSFDLADRQGLGAPLWRRRFFAGALAAGIAWGTSSLMMVRYGNPEHLAVSAFMIGGLVGGALATTSQALCCFRALAIPMLSMLTGAFLSKGDPVSLAMAGMTLVFLGAMLRTARQVHEVFRREVELRLANEGLVQSLTAGGDSLKITNAELTREIAERRRAEDALHRSEARLTRAQGIAQVGSWEYTFATGELVCSAEMQRLWGVQEGDAPLTWEALLGRVHPGDRATVEAACRRSAREAVSREFSHRLLLGDDTVRHVQQRWETECDAGHPVRLCGTAQDITPQRRAEDQLRLAARVFQDSVEGVMITDRSGRALSVNRAFTRITGYAEDDVVGHDVTLIQTSQQDRAFHSRFWQALRDHGFWQGELVERRKDGSQFPAWLSVSAVRDPEGTLTHFVGILSDMSQRKDAEAQIQFLAHHDALTGLPNRVLLRERFDQAAARARAAGLKVGLMFLDLDRFKAVNDSLGHLAGDQLLVAVSQRLRQCLRASDTVCRQGGDEFLAVMADVPTVEALANVAQKTLRCLEEPFEISGHALATAGSLGVSVFPDHGETFEVLLQRADTAMYEAKQSGRNAFRFYTENMAQNALELLEMQGRLRVAIEQGQLVLHYQPQVETESGRIVGVEALVRWNDPQTGLVSPAQFIPLAEESGLIVPLGAWVLREACRQMRAWIDKGLPPITVAVNLSAIQFARGNLVETVTEALREAKLPAWALEAELTESVLLQEQGTVVDTLHRLKGLGVQLSIDDFGTGYSSLAYLKRFAVDKLKIDQSFVRDLGRDSDDDAIVRAVVQMGRSLKLRTIAEGVETAAQLDFLRREGCEQAQGYFFSRPVPAAECARLLAARVLPVPSEQKAPDMARVA